MNVHITTLYLSLEIFPTSSISLHRSGEMLHRTTPRSYAACLHSHLDTVNRCNPPLPLHGDVNHPTLWVAQSTTGGFTPRVRAPLVLAVIISSQIHINGIQLHHEGTSSKCLRKEGKIRHTKRFANTPGAQGQSLQRTQPVKGGN